MENKIESAVKLLTKYFGDKNLKKPTLFHSIKAGFYLYDKNFDEEIVIGGFLHDILEDTEVSEKEITDLFGTEVLELVKANSKNKNLSKENVNEELIIRCNEYSEKALIIKAADILCNYDYYIKKNNQSEIDRCISLSKLVMNYKKPNYENMIFIELFNLN